MNKNFLVAFLLFSSFIFAQTDSTLIFSEIMFFPTSAPNEFIELYNFSETESIDLNGYQIIYSTSSPDIIIETGEGTVLPPKNFAVIFEGDYPFGSGIYDEMVPPQALVLIISDNSFGSSGMANTADRPVLLLSPVDDTLQAYTYSADNSASFSDEKIEMTGNNSQSNWENSLNPNGTPGFQNSVTPLSFDLEMNSLTFSPVVPTEGDDVTIFTKVKNKGMENAASYSIEIYNDADFDSTADPGELIFSQNFSNLASGDSTTASTIMSSLTAGDYQIISKVIFSEDENLLNNELIDAFIVFPPGNNFNDVVLNELMYEPTSGEPEWVELFNMTSSQLNLKEWTISDLTTTVTITAEDKFIPLNSFVILTKDSSILNFYDIPSEVIQLNLPSLNNSGDAIVIRDSLDVLIDSVLYSPDWGGSSGGRSLERISADGNGNEPSNWGTSISQNKATPGRINSVTPKQFDLSVAALNFNPRFPVLGDDVFVSALIVNNGSSDANNFNVEFLIDADSNNVVDDLLSIETGLGLASGDSANITSTFAIENLTSKVLTAVNIFYQEDEDTLNNYFEKSVQPGFPEKVIVINEVMYSPIDNEPEWVELINISGEPLNLKNWAISDILSSPTINLITSVDLFLQPDEFIIIAKDTSFNSHHPEVTSEIRIANFGSLGNTEDGIIIYDFREGIIDSLFYNSSWGGKNGYSLERISVDEETTDETNWTSSLSINRSTPGAQNSIENATSYEINTLIINEIMFEPGEDNSEFVEFLNLSDEPVNIGGWRIEDENDNFSRLAQTSFDIPPNSYFVLAADSLVIEKYFLNEPALISILDVSSLGLVNSGELILLKDVKGNVIDSVWYSDKWHNDNFVSTKNISLERINPKLSANDESNWSSSTNPFGGTPTAQNSIFTDNLNAESNISVSPNPFSPDNDGFEDFTIINYNLTQATSEVRIKIFDSKGRLVRTLLNNQPSGSSGSVIFDGRDDSGDALRIGIYIIFLEAINEGSGVVENMKTVVVVARKL